jgi:hypothetical protein
MDPQEHSEGGLFAETSDGDDSESDDEFAPTKKGSLFKQQSVETTLDELIDKDETKYWARILMLFLCADVWMIQVQPDHRHVSG